MAEIKKHTALKIILIVLGVISLLYGLVVYVYIGGGHWFNYAFIILGLGLIIVGVLINWILSWNKIVLYILLAIIVLVAINFTVFEVRLISTANNQYDPAALEHPKWIIVLGAKANGADQPSLEYSVRLKKAAQLSTSESILILTGGKGIDEPVSEAECAYNYLNKLNILTAKDVLLEDKSMSTSENLENAMAIIKTNGGSPDDLVLIISSDFHLYRASQLALEAGLANTCYAGGRGLPILEPYFCTREYAAYVREML